MMKRKECVLVSVFLDGNFHKSYWEKRLVYTKRDGTEWIRKPMQKVLSPVERTNNGVVYMELRWRKLMG